MAGRIPKQFIDDLILRTDIVDIIDAVIPLKKMGKNYGACCPFHEEKTPSFTVSPDKQFYHCFGCGAHGTAIGFLMEYEHMDFLEAVADLASRAGLQIPTTEGARPAVTQDFTRLTQALEQADHFYRQQLRHHPEADSVIDYLKGRGLSGEIAAEFGLGFAPEGWDNLIRAVGTDEKMVLDLKIAGLVTQKDGGGHYDRFRSRIMFPIQDYRGRLVGFGGRVVGDGEPKYLNSPETPLFHKGRELYGLYKSRDEIRQRKQALVVEGYMDVVALAQHGIRHAVASLGTAATRSHMERIFRYTPEVIFCFDGDRAGREAAWRALENALPVLEQGRQVSFLFLPEGEDPDSMVRSEGAEAFLKRISEAQALPDFLFGRLRDGIDLSRMDGRARLVELARPLMAKAPDGVLRDMMVDRLAQLAQTDRLGLGSSGPKTPLQSRRPRAAARIKRPLQGSLVRHAISLLIQNPDLAHGVDGPEDLQGLDLPGLDLLCKLLCAASERDEISTATLLEQFRDNEHHGHLEKLAAEQHMVEGGALAREFQDTLLRLKAQRVEQSLDRLLAKASPNPEDKSRINQLVQQQEDYKAQLAKH
ncbi:MAG TPA: DNA primase [Acidiferrobacteraceae bacterium]|nr:DNA primase [Acidiferrobacteraceae bacterium]